MAAAEYYSASAAQAASHQQSPYLRPSHQSPPYSQPQELYGSPVPLYNLPQGQQPSVATQNSQYGPPPPPYQPVQQDHKPTVHFAPTPPPPHQQQPVSRPTSGRPSISYANSANHGTPPDQYSQPPAPAQHASPNNYAVMTTQAPHMRPYMHGNQSEYVVNGYSSDPEPRRRRRHRRHEHGDDENSSRELRSRKDRSRSTNADGFLGAAGGGLIGDLIFPGLGTVGGAVAGWLGGKDYGKRRKHREEKLHQEQRQWEYKHRDRSSSDERSRSHERHHDHKSSARDKSGR